MASAFTHAIQTGTTAQANLVRVGSQAPLDTFVIPDLLGCLVLSWSEQRAQLLQSIARDESWQVRVCDDVQAFLRSIFQLDVPLTIVDLPCRGSTSYAELRQMATHAGGLNRSLLVICGTASSGVVGGVVDNGEEEQWARQLGAWAYLPGATDRSGLRLVFAEARKALARRSSSNLSSDCFSMSK